MTDTLQQLASRLERLERAGRDRAAMETMSRDARVRDESGVEYLGFGEFHREPGIPAVTVRTLPRAAFPWGPKWAWGFEFVVSGETTSFRLHNPMMRVGPTFYRAIVRDGTIGASRYFKTIDVSSYVSGNWGLAVDLDWAAGGDSLFDAEANVYTTEADLYAAQTPTAESSPERIPVAWFSGKSLVRDYLHGTLNPQVWVDPA